MHFLISPYEELLRSFVYVPIYCVGAGVTTLMSISLDPYFFRRKMEKTQSVKEEMDEEVFICRKSRNFSFHKYYD